jgi:membrane protein
MVTAIGMLTSIQSNSVVQFLINNAALGPIFVTGGKVLPYLLISAVFTFLYVFLPNTEVRFKSALVGGVASGVMWAAMGAVFATFVLYASRTQQIYAGFAVAITTLIWLYLNWLILLIGAQLAFYHQNPAFLRIGRQEPRLSNGMRERLALNTMFLTARAFRNPDESLTVGSLSSRLRIPSIALAPIMSALEAAGLLKRTGNEELIPGREVARIKVSQILEVVRDVGETGSLRRPDWTDSIADLGDSLDTAIASIVADRTLADLLDDDESRTKK